MWSNVTKLKHFWIFILILFGWAVFNYPIMGTLWKYGFDDGTYSHAYLVPFIVLYLLYILDIENRIIFRTTFSPLWMSILLFSGIALLLATLSQISLLYWAMSLLVLVALIFQVFRFNVSTFFPIAYLVFIYPFWGSLALLFQKISVFMVTLMMSFTSIPVYVENEFVTIPSGVFEIAEGCSGLRYIIVALAISSLYIFLYLRTFRSAFLFTIFALFGALLTNWVRIALLVIIGHETNMESSLMTDHNNFGWYIYVPVAILQFLLGRKLEEKEERELGKNRIVTVTSKREIPHRGLLVTLALSVLLSSSVAIMLTKLNPNVVECEQIGAQIKPEIFNASAVCGIETVVDNLTVTSLRYMFDGSTLDAKASYYLNSAIPVGYKEIGSMEHDEWNISIVTDEASSNRIIAYRYQVGSEYEAELYALKKERILSALKINNSTAIHWISSQCKQACNAEDLERLGL